MPLREWGTLTWEEARSLDPARVVAILPVGAVEARLDDDDPRPHHPVVAAFKDWTAWVGGYTRWAGEPWPAPEKSSKTPCIAR